MNDEVVRTPKDRLLEIIYGIRYPSGYPKDTPRLYLT